MKCQILNHVQYRWFLVCCIIGMVSFCEGKEEISSPSVDGSLSYDPKLLEAAQAREECCSRDQWAIIVSESYTFGKFAGFNKNYAELGLFVAPPTFKSLQGFVDLQGYRIGKHRWGGTVGGGVRWWNSSTQRALGANIYYDYREASVNPFHRIGIGLEYLGDCWDFRLNGYIPANGDVQKGSLHTFTYPGGFIETCRRKQYAFSGIDGEVGVPVWCKSCFYVYSALGGYCYRTGCGKFYGGYLRAEVNLWRYLSVEGRFSYDSRYRAQAQGVVALNVPLYDLWNCGGNQMRDCDLILTQPVYRNPMITTQNCCEYTQNW